MLYDDFMSIVETPTFTDKFKKIDKAGCNLDIRRQPVCLVINRSLFIVKVSLKFSLALTIDESWALLGLIKACLFD